jgi:peptide-methionine (S)-S-oxide reductase
MEQVMFGAGCFWGVELGFSQLEGVIETAVGYSGGHDDAPTYERVCSGTTMHTEVVLVTFDPDRISYERLLEVFWRGHDGTQVNRQGPDVGTQYRSAIYYYTEAQKVLAEATKAALDASGALHAPIATEIAPAQVFYPAEDYHQQYFEKRGMTSCGFTVN